MPFGRIPGGVLVDQIIGSVELELKFLPIHGSLIGGMQVMGAH
jgi:hypothetical protein